MKASSILLALTFAAVSVSAAPRFGGNNNNNNAKGAAANNNSKSGAAAANNAGSGAAATAQPATAAAAATASNSTSAADAASSSAAAASNNTGAAAATADTASTGTVSAGSLSTTDITTNATANNPDAQSSLTLNPAVIATGFMQNGQNVQEAGQVASLTSNNNFINYCLTQNVPITNGLQLLQGSCNPAPIGTIPAVGNMPSAKFANPANGDTIAANTDFTITMNIQNLVTGNFVNADESYFAAPQQVDASTGFIVGHTHVVMELLSDLAQTTPTNPQVFAFFKGVNNAADNGVLNVDVTAGVPAGAYRLCSINSSANHQPVIVPVAQHGALDDCVYFTASGDAAANSTAQASTASDSANPAAGAAAAAVTAFGNGSESSNNATAADNTGSGAAAASDAASTSAAAGGAAASAVVAQPATASPEAAVNAKAAKGGNSNKKAGGKRMLSRAIFA
jgi:hypothetical protein